MGISLGTQRLEDLRSYLLDSPDIVVHSLLATYKLFKVFHCAHEGYKHGGVIVKLFIPNVAEDDDIQDNGIKTESLLKPYRDATFLLQCRIWGLVHPNVIPYESAEISGRSGILMRQYFGRNLYDRLYSQPRLTKHHQQWFALQLLCAVAQLHSVGIVHGDIKSENVFIIGSFHAVLSDLATFIKPVYLPLDDPVAAMSLFFESGVKRRRCFIAPERFMDSLTSRVLDEHGRRMTFFDKQFNAAFARMDLFSAGLAIAEMYLEGQHIVDLPELLAFRTGNFDLKAVLNRIQDPHIRDLVLAMTERDPKVRPVSAMSCIESLLINAAPGFSNLLVCLMTVINHPIYTNADMRIMLLRYNWHHICGHVATRSITSYEPSTELEIFEHTIQTSVVARGIKSSVPPLIQWSQTSNTPSSLSLFPHPSLSRGTCREFSKSLFKLWDEGYRSSLQGLNVQSGMSEAVNELYLSLFTSAQPVDDSASSEAPDASVVTLLASLLGSSLTACSWTVSKVVCLDLMESLAGQSSVSDECISDYLIPYAHDIIQASHSCTVVKRRAMSCLSTLVSRLSKGAETGLFSEYLFPLCMQITNDPLVIPLASILMREAVRLSQPDEGGRKLAAIQFFGERFMRTNLFESNNHGWKWRKQLFESLDIFDLFSDQERINDLLVNKLEESVIMSSQVRDAVFRAIPTIIAIMKRANLWDTQPNKSLLTNLVLNYLYADDVMDEPVNILVDGIKGIGSIVTQLDDKHDKSLIVDCSTRLIPFIFHPVPTVREATQRVLVSTTGSKLSPVDQFVFLRNSLPKGCRTLVDLSTARRPLTGLSEEAFRKALIESGDVDDMPRKSTMERESVLLIRELSIPARMNRVLSFSTYRTESAPAQSRSVSETTLRSASPPLGSSGHHQLAVQIVNPGFASPHPIGSDTADVTLSLARFKDWKYPASSTPVSIPDLGCLSAMDGSLLRLYDGETSGNSLQRAFLSTLPCVPRSVFSGRSEWKPESLLLATLNEFCSTGLAVPVVGVDSTDDGRIIVGAGADGTIRLWRTNALETESVVQSSRMIQVPNCSRLHTVKTLRNTKSVVVGNDTRLLVYRVDAATASTGGVSASTMSGSVNARDVPVVQSRSHAFGHVLALDHFDADTSSCIVAATEKGAVLTWDLRTDRMAAVYNLNPVSDLLPSGLVVSKDAHGIVLSTLSGQLILLDNRFLKPVRTFSHTTGPISTVAHSGVRNSVWVSSGSDIGLFDVEKGGEPQQLLSVNQTGTCPTAAPALRSESPSTNQTALEVSLARLVKSESNARCVLECNYGPSYTVLSGHNDNVVRYWDPLAQTGGVAFPVQLEPTPISSKPGSVGQITQQATETFPVSLPNIAGRPCTTTEAHRDIILDMCVASLQYDIVVTGGRDGLIKLWK